MGITPIGETCTSPLARKLLLGHRSYGLIRRSRCLFLPWFKPDARSLRRLLPVPADSGIFPTLSLRILPRMSGPLARRSHEVRLPVPTLVSSAFSRYNSGINGSASRFIPRQRLHARAQFSSLQTFRYVQTPEFARLSCRPYRCLLCRAAVAFTPGQNVLRCLCTHRIC